MAEDAAELLTQALKLPPAARAAIADSLIDSLETEVDEDAEAAWRSEIALRVQISIRATSKRLLGTRFAVNCAAGSTADAKARPLPPGSAAGRKGSRRLVRRAQRRAAVRFLDEPDCLIDLTAVSPGRFPIFDADLRRAIFRRFPFYVVFRADDVNVVVFAVAHGKRRPRYWHGRT